MFEDSLVESSGKLAVRNPWTTAMSFAMQIMFCGFLMLLSLVYTDTLPSQRLTNALQAPPPPPAAPPIARSVAKVISTATELKDGALVLPREIPKSIVTVRDDAPVTGKAIGIAGDLPGGIPNGTPFGVAEVLRTTEPNVPKLAVQKVRVSSGVAQGMLIREVKPHYPALARQARIEGTVVLQAAIGKDGTIQNLRVISGHPMLVPAAMDAVKQWLYRPYLLNGEAVEVDTQINVNFTLAGG